MNEIEKREVERRLTQFTDVLSWLDTRIAQQVGHQLGQKLDREREYWRCVVTDLITEERERVTAYIAEERRELLNVIKQIAKEDHEQMVTKVNAIIEQLFDRLPGELAPELAAKLATEINKVGRMMAVKFNHKHDGMIVVNVSASGFDVGKTIKAHIGNKMCRIFWRDARTLLIDNWPHDIATAIAENGQLQFTAMRYPAVRKSA